MHKKRYFGTDGVRGPAGQGKLSARALQNLGRAVGQYFLQQNPDNHRAVIGRDTRSSGDMMEAALMAGLMTMGIDCERVGVVPSAATSLITRARGAGFGLMITASHNPYTDNGVKLFGPDGDKLGDAAQAEIEAIMLDKEIVTPQIDPGQSRQIRSGRQSYQEILKHSFDRKSSLSDLKVVLDCANGAGYKSAPDALRDLGMKNLIVIGNQPNGKNINLKCGSTHTEALRARVVAEKADLGIALDGDADRLIMCDEKGSEIDGDQILGLLAAGWQEQNKLARPGIAATLMSNLGLERFLQSRGLELRRTLVGDRHVAAAMRAEGFNLGGEQSGHILMTDILPTGDGTLAAVQVLVEIARQDRPASEVLTVFEPVPQILKNVRYDGASPLQKAEVQSAIKQAELKIKHGRILVRASGTEPLIRVMAEGDDKAEVEQAVDALASFIASAS